MSTPPIPTQQQGFNGKDTGIPMPTSDSRHTLRNQQPKVPEPADTSPESTPETPGQDHSRTRIIGTDGHGCYTPSSPGSGNTFKIIMIAAVVLIAICLGITAYYIWIDSSGSKEDKYNYREEYVQPASGIEEIPVEQELPAEDIANVSNEPKTPVPSSRYTSGVWKEGRNILKGTFNSGRAKYGFTIALDYSTSTGRASNATCESNGSVSPLSIATISSDGTVIDLRGSATEINVHAPEGSHTFTGTMMHGDYHGTCTMTLQ